MMKIALASDHAGYEMKQAVIDFLKKEGFDFEDLGAFSAESSDYPDWAHAIAHAVESGKYPVGISLCGTGNGINIAANKHQGIRSALCWSEKIAALARQHNDANICALPARFITDDEAVKIVKAFLSSSFEEGRHQRRKLKIPIQ